MQLESVVLPGAVPKMLVSTLAGLPPHPTRFWLNAAAPSNALAMLLTLATFQEPMFWLNALPLVLWNMKSMDFTSAVFHAPMFWLKAVAELNMYDMLVARAVFHEPMFWSNVFADWNIKDMVLTDAVFQLAMSWLNAVAW
jgi:hypothetical protein